MAQPDTVQSDARDEFLSHLKSENAFLRAQLEAMTQSEAQTKAALREALKAMPKQLTAGDSVLSDAAPSANSAPTMAPPDAATPPSAPSSGDATSPEQQQSAHIQKELRPLWKIVLGIR